MSLPASTSLTREMNFDGLVGPTHNYAGLSSGNVASTRNAASASHPRQAALQGLQKMRYVRDLGIPQGILLPHARPNLHLLHRLGFRGTTAQMLDAAYQQAPQLLPVIYSASAMWTANAATVSPSADTADGTLHFTPANLANKLHRAQEVDTTSRMLQRIFADSRHFTHHAPLPCHDALGDEGAANHTRLCSHHGARGLEVFVFGKYAYDTTQPAPTRYPARQTWEASTGIARLHGLTDAHTVFAQQHPDAIDAGVFHNDVIAVGNGNVLLYHDMAFLHEQAVKEEIQHKMAGDIHFLRISSQQVTLEQAVKSYLFNSQLLTLPEGNMVIVAPSECEETPAVRDTLAELCAQNTHPVQAVHYLDVRESMRNGGGPACLRLRVALNPQEMAAMHQGVILTDTLYAQLVQWVETHYRETLTNDDLRDPKLVEESFAALEALEQITGLHGLYQLA